MVTRRNKVAFIAVLVVLAALLPWILQKPAAPRVPPSPNGYDHFVKAVSLFKEVTTNQLALLTNKADLLLVVTNNTEALSEVREGLKYDSLISRAFDSNYIPSGLTLLVGYKRLASAMICEGRLAEMDQRTNRAAQIYTETMLLGNQSLRGGVIIDRLVGLALENMGRIRMQSLVQSLAGPDCHAAIKVLEECDIRRESFDDVHNNEVEWSRLVYPFYRRMMENIPLMIKERSFDPIKSTNDKLRKKINDNDLQRRQLMVALAAQAFALEKGRPPTEISDLVPDYLKRAPRHPVTGGEIALSTSGATTGTNEVK